MTIVAHLWEQRFGNAEEAAEIAVPSSSVNIQK
jgi:hypothetical protein